MIIKEMLAFISDIKQFSWSGILRIVVLLLFLLGMYFTYRIGEVEVERRAVECIVENQREQIIQETVDSLNNTFYNYIQLDEGDIDEIEDLVEELFEVNPRVYEYYLRVYQPSNTIEKTHTELVYAMSRDMHWHVLQELDRVQILRSVEEIATVTTMLYKVPMFVVKNDDYDYYLSRYVVSDDASAYVSGIYYNMRHLIGYHVIMEDDSIKGHGDPVRAAEIPRIINNIIRR